MVSKISENMIAFIFHFHTLKILNPPKDVAEEINQEEILNETKRNRTRQARGKLINYA